jgi:hypothetical protein
MAQRRCRSALRDRDITRTVRWAARFAVIGLFGREYLLVYWNVLLPQNLEHRSGNSEAKSPGRRILS